MEALVINLDSAVERMDFQKQQLESLRINFQRLPAYRIESTEDNTYQNYCNTWQRPMSLSEVSCFFSHKNAWDRVLEENQAMLILEDDAMLDQNIPCLLKALSNLDNIDYTNLEERKNRKRLLAKTSSHELCQSSLIRLYQGRSGAAAYILWPSGAKKLLKQMNKKGIGIADKFINENYSLKAYQIEPAAAIQLDQCEQYGFKSPFTVQSSISSSTNIDSKKTQWRFRTKRIVGELKIGLNHLLHLHHANRRRIRLSDHFKK